MGIYTVLNEIGTYECARCALQLTTAIATRARFMTPLMYNIAAKYIQG